MFEKASRLKVRFETPKGSLVVDDLWDLPLTSSTGKANLDDIARDIHAQLKNGTDVSFVKKEQKSDPIVQLKFDIVKHIIDVRLAENDAAATARSNAEKKQQLLAIIAQREFDHLASSSLEELRAQVASL